jgi:hypothetical protein
MKTLMWSALALALAAPAQAIELGSISGKWSLANVERVRIEFPAGRLTVQSGDGPEARATLAVRCRTRSDHCVERSKRIRLITELKGTTRVIEVQPKEWNFKGLEMELIVEVPATMSVETNMGAGELDIYGLEGHLNASLGAGDADIRMRERAIRSVDASVGVGDASLKRQGVHVASHGFLGRSVKWNDGRGAARLEVHVGVGDIDVRLD